MAKEYEVIKSDQLTRVSDTRAWRITGESRSGQREESFYPSTSTPTTLLRSESLRSSRGEQLTPIAY